MDIKTERLPDGQWSAIDADTYDAESDSVGSWSNSPVGYGKTERNAIIDLLNEIAPNREPVAQALNSIIMSLIDIGQLAADPATYDEVAAEEEAIWNIKGRIELLTSYIKIKQNEPINAVILRRVQ